MSKSKKIWIAVIIIFLVALIGWRWQVLRQKNTNAITVGVAVGETGDGSEWGQGEFNVYQMYADDINAAGGIDGHPIVLDVQDTKSTGEGTVTAVTKLISIDHVPVVLGPTWADSYQGANPIAEQAKTVLLTPSTALETIDHKENFTYLFSTYWPQLPEIQTLDGFMVSHQMKTLAVINDHDPFDTKFADELAADAATKGVSVVDREQVSIDTNDFRTEILKIKQMHPDAVFIEISNIAGLGPFMGQVKQLGLSAKIFSTADAQNADVVSKFGADMEGLAYSFPQEPTGTAYANFVQEYKTKYGTLPSAPSVMTAYNAIAALVAVLREGARTGTEIRDALYKVTVPGLGAANISFNNLGAITQANFDMKMIHNGQFVIITN